MRRIARHLLVLIAGTLITLAVVQSAISSGAWHQDKILITFWCQPPAEDKPLTDCAAQHFNLTWCPERGLDEVARHHLKAMLFEQDIINPDALADPEKRKKLDALIERVKNHPAMEAYFVCDEPPPLTWEKVGRLVSYIKARDPKHLPYVNVWGIYAIEAGSEQKNAQLYRLTLETFINMIKPKLLSFDNYVLLKSGDLSRYFLNLEILHDVSEAHRIPFMNIFQASTYLPQWRFPTASELRWQAFTSLAYGARGISYFTYWGPAKFGGLYRDGQPVADAVNAVTQINGEVQALSPELMSRRCIAVYHSPGAGLPSGTHAIPKAFRLQIPSNDGFVLGVFGKHSGPDSFMIVNRDYARRKTAPLRLMNGELLAEFDKRVGLWKPAPKLNTAGLYDIDLEPGDGRFFRFR